MTNAINFLRIQNFKSLKDVTLRPRRVNLIIGEPNVGKSNLLEAMSLLGGLVYEPAGKFLGSFIRYEEPRQLFYDNLVANTIKVETDKDVAVLLFDKIAKQFGYLFCDQSFYQQLLERFPSGTSNRTTLAGHATVLPSIEFLEIKDKLIGGFLPRNVAFAKLDNGGCIEPVSPGNSHTLDININPDEVPRRYSFSNRGNGAADTGTASLTVPHGDNLVAVLQNYPELRREVAGIFARYGQKLQLRMDERRIEVVKDLDGITYAYPYSSVADTLQRFIFYLAAIESNDDAVLLFEEPEAHSFPVYVSRLGRRIVESRNNQFFIDTHSPYLVTEVLEEMLTKDEYAGELAIFAAYYEDHQTKVHQLSDEEIFDIRADGIDVFYNMKRFTTGRADA